MSLTRLDGIQRDPSLLQTLAAHPSQAAAFLGLVGNVQRDFAGAGSNQATTASTTAGSATVTLAAPLDFRNGQGIAIANAGPVPPTALPNPSAPSLAQASGSSSFTANEVVYVGITYTDMAGNQTLAAVSSITMGAAGNTITLSETIPFGGTGLGVYVGTTSTPLLLGTVTLAGGITYSGGATSGLAVSVSGTTITVTISAPATSTGASEPTSNTTSTTPTAPTVTAAGTTGTTSWAYALALIDGQGGVTPASPATTITNGNATLSPTNYNAVTWPAVSAAGIILYRTTAGGTPNTTGVIGIVAGASLHDTGLGPFTPPTGIPASPSSTAAGAPLVATIQAGAGTTTLTLSQAASTSVSGATVYHDDTAALQGAASQGGWNFIPPGTYNVSSTISLDQPGTVLAGADQTVKWFPGSRVVIQTPWFLTGPVFQCMANDTSLSGSTISSPSPGQVQPAVTCTGMGNTCSRLEVTNLGGITYNGASRFVCEDCVAQGYTGLYGFNLTNTGIGFLLRCNAAPGGNNPPGAGTTSYYLLGGGSLNVMNCEANGLPDYGLQCLNSSDNEFYGFEVNGANVTQILVSGGNDNVIIRPYVLQPSPTGITLLNTARCTIATGWIGGASGNQVLVQQSGSGACYDITLVGNWIDGGNTSTGSTIKVTGGVQNVTLVGNHIDGNFNTSTSVYGVEWDVPSPSYSLIAANTIRNYAAAQPISLPNGTDATLVIQANQGFTAYPIALSGNISGKPALAISDLAAFTGIQIGTGGNKEPNPIWIANNAGSGTFTVINTNAGINVGPIEPNTIGFYNQASGNQIAALDNNGNWAFRGACFAFAPVQTLAGTTAGTVYWVQSEQGTRKVFTAVFQGYENDTTTNQMITFPTAFQYPPAIATNTTGLTVTATTTTLTINAPNATTTFNGVVEVVGI